MYKRTIFRVLLLLCVAAIASIAFGLHGNPKQQAVITERDYAEQFIKEIVSSYERAVPNIEIVDRTITRFERIGGFDQLLDTPVQIWALEYRLKPDNPDTIMLPGGMNAIDGLLTEEGSMGKPVLIFTYQDAVPEYLGEIYRGANDLSTPAEQEIALRTFFEREGQLPHETFSGKHILVKFRLTTGETSQLLMSQPVKQGEQGIWAVERWKDTNGNEYYNTPQTEETLADYYAGLQSRADQGMEPSLLDPLQVAVLYIKSDLGQPVSRDKLIIDYEAAAADFLVTPESKLLGYISGLGVDLDTIAFDQVEWLTLEDSERLAALNLDEEDLPGGYYILNKYEMKDSYKITSQTQYKLLDWDNLGTEKSVSKPEFIQYFEQFTGFSPPCTITVRNGVIQAISEFYVP